MSDNVFPASKKIFIGNTGSLADLKAELLKRKADAANKQKVKSDNETTTASSRRTKWQSVAEELSDKNSKSKKKEKPKTEEDVELDRQLMLSKAALERKAKLYEERYNKAKAGASACSQDSSDEEWDSENGPNGLVDFREKVRLKIEMPEPRIPSPVPIDEADDDDYVEFTDSFGRTRKCLKKNLKHYQKLDREAGIEPRVSEENDDEEEIGPQPEDNRTWEEVRPVGPIRYQELIQDEVREHGVGFFRFSADEDVRSRQMEMLKQIHDEALRQRKLFRIQKRAEKEAKRAKLASEQGVPIESIPSEPSSDEEESLPESFDRLSERDKYALAAKEISAREWDSGKRDAMGRLVQQPAKKKRVTAEMACKAFADERRQERDEMFAPPSSYFASSSQPSASSHTNTGPTSKKTRSQNDAPDINQIISEKLAFFKNAS